MAARPVWSWLCLLLLSQCRVLFALEVTPGSSCAALCLNNPESDPLNPASSSTSPSDITCSDEGYSETSAGIKFKNCLECLRDSRDAKNGENDVSWFLYNLRYSVNVCLYGYPNVTTNPISSPCDINYACEPLKMSLRAGNLVPNNGTQLDYCEADGGKFQGPKVSSCLQCLQASPDQTYTANFLVALRAGCEQRPKSGALIGLSGNLFSNAPVTISEPPVNEADLKDGPSPTGMTTGAIVGIAVGAGLLFLGGSALFFVYYRKQKRLYGDDLNSEYDDRSRGGAGSQQAMMRGPGGHSAFDFTQYSASQYELRSESQQQQQQQVGFGRNADYYDEIEKEMQMQALTARVPNYNYNFDPHSHMRGPNGALPTHPAYIPKSLNRASREHTPEPPRLSSQASHHSYHNQPEAYAANPYLNAAPAHAQPPALSIPASTHQAYQHHRRSASIPPPPPGPPPSQQQQHHQQNSNANNNERSILAAAQRSISPSAPAPPPPPPPPPRAPRLTLPSVRKLRVPKKYAPPQIVIEEPTPVSSPGGGEVPIGLEISNPLPHHLQRFADNQHPGMTAERGGGRSSSSATASQPQQRTTTTTILSMPDHGGIRQQHAVDRRPWNNGSGAEYVEIYTSKSDIYG
ncbi:uncharacterized protein PG986_004382 [Apiospora aurea]|uniref:Uncharacterized protein n=1 Tax=Apiospora aurea TaxID=335848 RepID=A0ABR1QMN3_9PEZI